MLRKLSSRLGRSRSKSISKSRKVSDNLGAAVPYRDVNDDVNDDDDAVFGTSSPTSPSVDFNANHKLPDRTSVDSCVHVTAGDHPPELTSTNQSNGNNLQASTAFQTQSPLASNGNAEHLTSDLIAACVAGNFEAVRLAVKAEANVNAYGPGMYASHRTALHAAAEAGHVTVVQYLLRHGADIEMRNWDGKTALQVAIAVGHVRVAGAIVEYMFSVDKREREPFFIVRALKGSSQPETATAAIVEETPSCAQLKSLRKRGCCAVEFLLAYKQQAEHLTAYLTSVLDIPVRHAFLVNTARSGELNSRNFQRFDVKSECETRSLTLLNSSLRALELANGFASLNSLVLVSCGLARLTLGGGLPCLETFDVTDNSLREIPDTLTRCLRLVTLRCSKNSLRKLPKTLGQLGELAYLDFSHNAVRHLPATLVQCTKLRVLRFEHNDVGELPIEMGIFTELEELTVNNNRIPSLPSSIASLDKLKLVTFRSNPLLNIPLDFPEEPSALREYLRYLQEDPVPNKTVKLVIVGQEGVGKTTLLRALKRNFWLLPSAKASHGKTEGIDVRDIDINDVTLRCFDCGGDVDFADTHNFFITPGAVYLACFDLSEYVRATVERDSFLLGRLQLWLQYINSKVPSACVIIVGTHADDPGLTQQTLTDIWAKIRAMLATARPHHRSAFPHHHRLPSCLLCQPDSRATRKTSSGSCSVGFVNTGYAASVDSDNSAADDKSSSAQSSVAFPHIVGYYEISSVKPMGNDSALPANVNQSLVYLKEAILELARRFIELSPDIPRRWAHVAEALQSRLSAHRVLRTVTLAEVASIAAAHGIDGQEMANMMTFFQGQGYFLHFPAIKDLENIVVLDPAWLAHIFAAVASHKNTAVNSEGFMDRAALLEMLKTFDDGSNGPVGRLQLLELLHQFGVCLPVTESKVEFVPSRLPYGEPLSDIWPPVPEQGERQLTVWFTFPVPLPPPFFNRLAVALYRRRVDASVCASPPSQYYANHVVDTLSVKATARCERCGVVTSLASSRDASPKENGSEERKDSKLFHRVHVKFLARQQSVACTARGNRPCCMIAKVKNIVEKMTRCQFEGVVAGAFAVGVATTVGPDSGLTALIACPVCVLHNADRPCLFDPNDTQALNRNGKKLLCKAGHALSDGFESVCLGNLPASYFATASRVLDESRSGDFTDCPKLFILLPISSLLPHGQMHSSKLSSTHQMDLGLLSSVHMDGYAVHFLCEFPDGYHPIANAPGFRIKDPEKFMRTHGAHVCRVMRALRLILGSSIVPLGVQCSDLIINDLLASYAKAFPFLFEAKPPHPVESPDALMRAIASHGVKRYELRNLLRCADRPDKFGPLRRLRKGNQILWLCENHFRQLGHVQLSQQPIGPRTNEQLI